MSIAWYIQAVQSAFASAMTGGLIMARAAYQVLLDRHIDLGGLVKPNHEDSSLDEMMSYAFAFVGFIWQVRSGFTVPFPLNVLLWPLSIAEYFLRWSVTSRKGF